MMVIMMMMMIMAGANTDFSNNLSTNLSSSRLKLWTCECTIKIIRVLLCEGSIHTHAPSILQYSFRCLTSFIATVSKYVVFLAFGAIQAVGLTIIATPGPTALLMGNAMATGRSGAVRMRMVLAENAQAFARVGGPFAFASAFLISCRQEYLCYFSFA